jgi:hypothetical protein
MKHPFPITPETEKSWMRSNAETFAPWSTLRDDPNDFEGEPKFLTFARWWHYDVDPLVKAMDQMIRIDLEALSYNEPGMEEVEQLRTSLYGMIRALMLRFDQFNGLLDWAQHTWREDPRIRSHSNKKPSGGGKVPNDRGDVISLHRK